MGPEDENPAWAHRLGAAEGTGLGFLAAGAILGMVWLGKAFGSELPFGEGAYAAGFLAAGTGILVVALGRARQ
jgi:hypothetical protein